MALAILAAAEIGSGNAPSLALCLEEPLRAPVAQDGSWVSL